MDDTDRSSCGCFFLVLLLALVCVCAYPLYDGYINRSLPKDERSLITATVSIDRVADSWHLTSTITNKSEWIVGTATVTLSVTLKDGRQMSFTGNLESFGKTSLDISNKEGRRSCQLILGPNAAGYFSRAEVDKWTWWLEIDGRRRPIRLVKGPIDWIRSLFDRVDQ